MLEQGSTGHAISDAETQEARNRVILKITSERLAEDFEIRKKRFDLFKTKYSDFVKNEKWSKLLELSDMNGFLQKSYNGRKKFLQEIKDIINDPKLTENIAQQQEALKDLLSLTHLYNFDKTKKPLNKETQKESELIINKDNKEVLADALKNAFTDYATRLDAFNEALHNLPEINTLNMLQKIENASNQASIALGFAALFAMVAGPAHLAVLGVTITVEKFAFFAKAALVTGHVTGAKAEDLKIEIQNKITEQMEAITNTALPKASFFKNMGDSLGKRFKNWLNRENSYQGKAYKGIGKAMEWLKNQKDNTTAWWNRKEQTSDIFKKIGTAVRVTTGAGVLAGKVIGKGIAAGAKAIGSGINWTGKQANFEYHNVTTYKNLSREEAKQAYEKQKEKDRRDAYNKSLKKFLPFNINLNEDDEDSYNSALAAIPAT